MSKDKIIIKHKGEISDFIPILIHEIWLVIGFIFFEF